MIVLKNDSGGIIKNLFSHLSRLSFLDSSLRRRPTKPFFTRAYYHYLWGLVSLVFLALRIRDCMPSSPTVAWECPALTDDDNIYAPRQSQLKTTPSLSILPKIPEARRTDYQRKGGKAAISDMFARVRKPCRVLIEMVRWIQRSDE